MLLTILALTGCFEGRDGDLAQAPYCEENAVPIGIDEVSELGFSADEVLSLALGEHLGEVSWDRGSDAAISVSVGSVGEARFIDAEVVQPEGGDTLDIWVECPDRVEVDVVLELSTDDGWFDESFELALYSFEGSEARFHQELELDALAGSFDIEPDVTSVDYDELRAWVSGSFDEEGLVGVVEGQASGEDECEDGEPCSAWAEMVEIGSFEAQMVDEP